MRNKVLVLIFYLVVAFFFTFKIQISNGLIIGGDWSTPETFSQMQNFASAGIYAWSYTQSLFGSAMLTFNDYPFRIFVGVLSNLGMDGRIFNKIFLLFLFTLSGFSTYLYCRFLKLNEFSSVLGGFFLISSPLFFNYTIMGWTYVLLSIGLLPLALITFTKSIKEKTYSNAIITGLLYSVAMLQSQTLIWYPIAFILLSFFLVRSKKGSISCAKSLIIIFLIFFLIHFSWIIPLLLFPNPVISQAVAIFDINRFGIRLNGINLLRLWGSLFNYQYESSLPSSLLFITFVPPLVAYFALLVKKDRMTLNFTLLSFVPLFIFMVKGIFQYIPFSAVIRDTSRFMVLSTVAYSILIAMTIDTLVGKVNRLSIKCKWDGIISRYCGYALAALIILNSYPFWIGELYGEAKHTCDVRLRTLEFPKEYYAVENILAKKGSSYKALYLPLGGMGIRFLDDKRFNMPHHEIVDVFGAYSSVPGIIFMTDRGLGILQDFAQILQFNIVSNESAHLSDLLGLANIKYIIVRLNMEWGSGEPTMKDVTRKFETKTGLRKIYENRSIVSFENPNTLPKIYITSIPNLVSSPVASLIPLTYTSYFDGRPALAFTEQQSKNDLLTLIGEEREAKGERKSIISNKILFVNRNFDDFLIDLAKAESQPNGLQSVVRKQNPILIKLDKKGRGKFKVDEDGVYEVWAKNNEALRKRDSLLKIGEQELEVENRNVMRNEKWIKAGEVRLDKGKQKMLVKSEDKRLEGIGENSEEIEQLLKEMEIVIGSKEKREEYEDLLKSKGIGYLFYIDKEKIEKMLEDEERLEAIKLSSGNPFKIDKQKFYFPKDGTYSVKALVRPKRDFLMSDFVSSSSSSSTIKASLDEISGWDIKPLNTTYKHNILAEGMHVDAYFRGKGDVKESIVLSKKFSNINIKERPYLAFYCEMKDTGVQEVEMDIQIVGGERHEAKGKSNLSKKLTLKADNKQYVVNLYEMVKGKWQKARGDIDNLYINEVVLRFKKKDGVDLSDERKRRIYSFIFKKIAFLKTQPIVAEFEDKLTAYLPDYYYFFNRNGELKKVDFPEQIPWDIKDVYRLHLNRFIDLKETPVLSLNFPKPVWGAGGWRLEAEGRDGFPSEWKVILGIDFDGDEKEDNRIEAFVAASGLVDGKLLLKVRAYEEIKKRFPNKKIYNLIYIGISHPDDQNIVYQNVVTEKLIRYREHIYKPLEVRGERQEVRGERIEAKGERQEAKGVGVLEVDGKIYKLPPKAKGVRQEVRGKKQEVGGQRFEAEGQWVEFNNVYLKKGEHTLNVLENERFKVEMVEIKPVNSRQLTVNSQEPPKIEFNKINPTRYVVDVKEAKEPFTLVFSESFHEGWKAYVRKRSEVGGQMLEAAQTSSLKPQTFDKELWSALRSAWKDRGNRIEIKDHFVVNGYANGWIVPVDKFKVQSSKFKVGESEDFEIVLEFKPQRFFEIGLLVSAMTFLGCIGYLGYDFRKRRKRI